MEELMEILEDICPDVDFEKETALLDDRVIQSFHVISIVSEISEAFGITISPADLIPANFNSAQAMWDMIQRYKK